MYDFFSRAVTKLGRLTAEQCRELLAGVTGELGRLETVLDSLPDGIVVCGEQHRLALANKAAQRLLPLAGSEGTLLWALVQDEALAAFFKTALSGGDRVQEREFDVQAQGRSRLLSISVLPLVRKRRITGSLIYAQDITEKRQRELQLRRAESLASLTTLAAGVAHEIKNPLGSISIHLQLLQKLFANNSGGGAAESAAASKYFTVLTEEVARLNRIVVDFLFAVRPLSLNLREGDINALVAELAEFVKAELAAAGIRILLELADNLPPALIDERLLKQALLNLVQNARSAMHSGGLLTIATLAVDSSVRISVCDTGCGISEENIAKIFEPYFTTSEHGTGLGLTMVYKIIKEHRGEIAVDSREGEGAAFEILLPAVQKEQRLLEYSGGGRQM